MATLRVRYKNGDSDEWDIHERMDVQDLTKVLHFGLGQGNVVSFGVATREGHEDVDYGFVGLQMSEVVMWEVDGILDDERVASVWGLNQPDAPGTG